MPSLSYQGWLGSIGLKKLRGLTIDLKGGKLDFPTPVHYKVCQTDKPI